MDLTTHYLGLSLRNPLVASASPLSVSLDRIVALANSGVGAIVLYSLFEEEVHREELRDAAIVETHENAFGEAMTYFPTTARPGGAEASAVSRYLKLIERASATVSVPVIGSLNGSTEGGWTRLARSMQDAGAAAIELNIYFVPGDPHTPGRVVACRDPQAGQGERHHPRCRQAQPALQLARRDGAAPRPGRC